MPLQLPTDTQHLRLDMRQYEIFGRSLGQGIRRQVIWVATAAVAVWAPIAFLILGVDPLSRFAPMVYIVPIAVFTISATRLDNLGRIQLMRWYDWVLSRTPARRRVITNPAVDATGRVPDVMRIVAVCELHPRTPGEEIAPIRWGRRPGTHEDTVDGVW